MTLAAFRERANAVRAGGGGGARRIVPLWREVLFDNETPVSAFAKLRRSGGPFSFLLESAPAGGETWSRYSFLGSSPRAAWRLTDGVVEDWSPDAGWHNARRPRDPLADLEALLEHDMPLEVPEAGDFWSGAVGFFAYDVVRLIERLPNPPSKAVKSPDALFVFTGALVIIDNLRSHARVVVGVPIDARYSDDEVAAAYRTGLAEIERTIATLRGPATLPPFQLDADAPPAVGTSTYAPERFKADVERIREYIVAGDAFQVLLARRIEVPHDFSSEALYRTLRAINPSPYMYHLCLDGVELVGSSPELLVRVGSGKVTVRPIAGTRRRGRTAEEDEAMRAELLSDEKERAEHLMLVDLGRNDVGRIAQYGTVQVTDLMAAERYSHVHHMVSTVEGPLRPGGSAMDACRAAFAAGTMTGARKVRAMEIIDELEPERRGPYAGAVGYIAAGGQRMALAITIRTCVIAAGVASVQTGAGIVHDSVPELEWKETENKARVVLTAIGKARAASP